MNETVKILNPLQFKFYLKHGVKPVDLEIGFNDKVVYIYKTEGTKEVWKLWQEQCVEYQQTKNKVK